MDLMACLILYLGCEQWQPLAEDADRLASPSGTFPDEREVPIRWRGKDHLGVETHRVRTSFVEGDLGLLEPLLPMRGGEKGIHVHRSTHSSRHFWKHVFG